MPVVALAVKCIYELGLEMKGTAVTLAKIRSLA